MKLCLNQITYSGQAPADGAALATDLATVRAGGWTALELWLRHWDGLCERLGLAGARRVLDDSGLVASGGCAQGGLFFTAGDERSRSWDGYQRRLEQCQALGASHLVIIPGPFPDIVGEDDLPRAADRLRAAGDVARAHGVTLGIEFLKGVRLVNNLPTAVDVARRTAHPHVGVLVDTFHLYAGLSKVEDLDLLAGPEAPNLTFVHINDVPSSKPRELWTDPDRVLPGEGSFPLAAINEGVRRSGYDGYLSLELFNEAFRARWQEHPEESSRQAYLAAAAAFGPIEE